MRGEVRPCRGAKLPVTAGLLLLATVLAGSAVSQAQQTTEKQKSSCVTCHLDAAKLEQSMTAGAEPAKSPLQAGAG